MEKKIRYFKLKMLDGWHVFKEITYSPSREYFDCEVIFDTEESAMKLLRKLKEDENAEFLSESNSHN